ncbi:MAG: phosphotransferase family protein [Gammaproteobacteria bacterium]|nr:phosphotransferase family protein [Gammaproteobacteria bacterium]
MDDVGDGATTRVGAWLTHNLGGRLLRIARQGRWRPVWFADLERDGERLGLCIRGERTDTPLVFPLAHEMRFQALLHEHGIPVPKVHGWIDEPAAIVMERVGGQPDFERSNEAERRAVVDDYLQILARLHALDLRPFLQAGILRAGRPGESGTFGMARYERNYRAAKKHPDPFLEFCLGWLHRNPPDSKGREAPIVWDSGQFHHRDGRVVALLDLELAHIGDPMMDLAGWRLRDTVIGYGKFTELYARYEGLTGRPVDLDAIRRHHFAFALANQLAFSAALRDPAPASDLMINLRWCGETNLFATEALAEMLDIEPPAADLPASSPSRAAPAHRLLMEGLRGLETGDEFVRYRLHTLFRIARHVARVDEIGAAVDAADLDDLHRLLGRRPDSWREGEAELERFVLADAATGRHDEALVKLFHRRNLRALMVLGPAGSAMTSHMRIQSFGVSGQAP